MLFVWIKVRKIEGKSMKINEMTRCTQNKELKLKIEYSNKELSALIHMPVSTISDCNKSLEAKGYLEGASEFIKRFPQDKLNLIFIEKFKEQDERMDNIEDEVRMLREELARLKKERELERNINTQMIL